MEHDSETRFRNVDLEVSSASDLGWLVDELGEDVTNLYCGPAQGYFLATFEAKHVFGDPDALIGFFCGLVEALPGERQREWKQALLKIFNIGYDGGYAPPAYQSDLRPDTIAAVARIGASLRITIYPAGDPLRRAG
jgi:hypothetical protein